MSTPVQVSYTPTEDEKNTALSVIGWALREEMNRLQANLSGRADKEYTKWRKDLTRGYTDSVVAMIQRGWDRYLERVGRG